MYFSAISHRFGDINVSIVDLQKVLQVTSKISRNEAIRWPHCDKLASSESIKFVPSELSLFLDILTFKIVVLQRVGHGHGVLFSQCRRSMANIKICKSRPMRFCTSSNRFRYIKVTEYNVQCHSMANVKVYKRSFVHFYFR